MTIENFDDFEEADDDVATSFSGEVCNIFVNTLKGEPSQLMHNCRYSGAEAWRTLIKRYSPSIPLRAMQLMLQVANPGQTKNLKDVPHIIDKWETNVLTL